MPKSKQNNQSNRLSNVQLYAVVVIALAIAAAIITVMYLSRPPSFVSFKSAYKLTFLPDAFNNYDAITAQTSTAGAFAYQNLGSTTGISNVTEPAQELTVTSQVPNAFQYGGVTGSSIVYDLTPYQLNQASQTNNAAALGAITTNAVAGGSNVVLTYAGSGPASGSGAWISSTQQLTVTISGATSAGAAPQTTSVTFSANTGNAIAGLSFFNITNIQLSRALPGVITVNVISNSVTTGSTNNGVLVGQFTNVGTNGALLYQTAGKSYMSMSTSTGATYNPQNGQPPVQNGFTLKGTFTQYAPAVPQQYYTYTINEISVPTNTAAVDSIAFGIVNATGGTGVTPVFQMNYSASASNAIGTHANMTYMSSIASNLNAQAGFRTERGSKLASITPNLLTIDLAKTADMLNFAIGPSNSAVTTTGMRTIGPFGIGQAITGFANLSVSKVTATPTLSGASQYTITGIDNITATPSRATAITPVWLNNMTTPLVVLDSAASQGSNLILVGSGYVNALSAQLQRAYNVSMTPSTQIMQAYGTNRVLIAGYYANQTTSAANAFIAQLYRQAAGS